ncbi:hypothetical protein H5P28_01820 [Ruficoccus amylovorans]|uniref:Uncharacterized protein n=1 Tax=Ruficoccus amylovorans TaxID=1804625 RepID=A0A842HA68_9BACT|nr:hypothetical protein [Ruficoccus amylovorans]MBC2592988.1 hypothetical protein [Ruficoccus amylovorans]
MDNKAFPRFLIVEHHDEGRVTVLVHHLGQPRLMVEFEPRLDAEGKVTGGTLKRVCAENAWCGGYGQYSRLVGQAEKFFHRSLESDIPPNRLQW